MRSLTLLQARWVGSRHPGDTIPLTRPTILVGRGKRNDIIVEHEAISSRHLEIHLRPDGAAVRDLGSTNGTFREGRRLPAGKTVALPYGSALRLHNCLELRLLSPGAGLPVEAMPPRLHFVQQPQPGLIIVQARGPTQRVPLRRTRTLLGRSSACDIVVNHPLVSRQHAEVVAQGPGQFYIRDLGSRHGLTFQGQRIQSKALQPGERLSIADVQPGTAVTLQFEPALGFLSEPEASGRVRSDQTSLDVAMTAMAAADRPRLVTCPGCGALNFGPHVACLRCQTPMP